MKKWILILLAMLVAGTAQALNPVQESYVERLARGGFISLKDVSQSIYHSGERDTQVLDVLAEVLLQDYQRARGRGELDAVAWGAKALGASGNGRYHGVLSEIDRNNTQRKLSKHVSRALSDVGAPSGEQYQRGMVDLAKLQESGASAARSAPSKKAAPARRQAAAPAAAPAAQGNYESLSLVREGMSMQEVYDLVGPPSATYSRQTGKAWKPFNYRGNDIVRTYALYKNQGRVVFSNTSRYSGVQRVREVIIDPNESGYP
ncbi:hypothetical protein [Alkalilimnicola sp. S0819]|uniref:hypothetical protein n=1 Tax=Alkalilimnicola sp. S0819 TaxID=2613922 RepID=UPI001261A4FA|nr:hypothetical protein [Alkalilimnicola sp. S0819]KAB7623925.1 outer membrane protein assembly factor BamE [Alkalilimnicola sp. S0819]MPQ16522.1 hypothetical protein [Alkalilimnicola sp. S0819]